ncbi:hypothetical protein ACL02S_22055 [Nocardia sp. 004]|uniref:hypothetical protein n=1 Tax=Nocardia sp. 004 TaxID=3385978 RepID=UPI0039A1DF7B
MDRAHVESAHNRDCPGSPGIDLAAMGYPIRLCLWPDLSRCTRHTLVHQLNELPWLTSPLYGGQEVTHGFGNGLG